MFKDLATNLNMQKEDRGNEPCDVIRHGGNLSEDVLG